MGELNEKLKGAANQAAGNTKQAIGKMTDSERLRQEGLAQERKGEAQHVEGEFEGELGNKI